jgi:hypothetical protein
MTSQAPPSYTVTGCPLDAVNGQYNRVSGTRYNHATDKDAHLHSDGGRWKITWRNMTVYETLNTTAVPTSVTWKDVLTSATLELRVTPPHQQSQTSTTAGSTTAPVRTEPVRPAPTPSRQTTGNITLDVILVRNSLCDLLHRADSGSTPADACKTWNTDISNPALAFSSDKTTARRNGDASCYPAVFSKLVGPRATFEVRLDSAPLSDNWLSFGLTVRGMARIASDGFGRTANSWGITDDRDSASWNRAPLVMASGAILAPLPRKLKSGDVMLGFVDVTTGLFEVRLNRDEFSHRFTIPEGTSGDYWFGMTLANDHQVTIINETIVSSGSAAPASVPTPTPAPAPAPAQTPSPMPARSKQAPALSAI